MATVISPTHTQPINQSIFITAAKIIKENNKDLLDLIKFIGQWAQTFFKELELVPELDNLITFAEKVKNGLSIHDTTLAFCRLGHFVSNIFNEGIISSIPKISRTILELNWSAFKLCKALRNEKIYLFGKRFITNFAKVGGISFAISSLDRIYSEAISISQLDWNQDTEIFCRFLRVAKSVGTFAIGLIVSMNAIYGTIVSGTIMLAIGTMILTTSIFSSYLKEAYHLNIK
jgi:hypothetical protein